MASLQSLRDLFVEELKDLYNAEQQILKALPKMRKSATNPRLVNAIDQHLEQTRTQVDRLERIFDDIQESPRGKKCKGMEGLIDEGKEFLDARGADEARDAAIIGAAQKVEHYEISAYGTACAHARATGNTTAEQLLQQTLEEEKETDRLLTEIAEGGINEWASEAEARGNGQAFGNGPATGVASRGASRARNGGQRASTKSRARGRTGRAAATRRSGSSTRRNVPTRSRRRGRPTTTGGSRPRSASRTR